jgi:carboxypeptidase D
MPWRAGVRVDTEAEARYDAGMRHVLVALVLASLCLPARGEWVDVRVQLEEPAAVDRLRDAGFTVRSVRGDTAVLHVNDAGRERLKALGYAPAPLAKPKALEDYPAFDAVAQEVHALAGARPDLARAERFGTSAEGRPLLALVISDNVDVEEVEPEIAVLSTLHGDEPLGTILTLTLAGLLLEEYEREPRVRRIVDGAELWLVPCVNPDGYIAGRRFNAAGVDLNRDYPRYPREFTGTLLDGAPLRAAGRQPETAAVMRWAAERRLVLSTNLHTGALVFNYPYDDNGGLSGLAQPAPDDALFVALGEAYASANPPMASSPWFPGGITNGAAWYVIKGGLQDWAYRYLGSLSVTLELADDKAPPASDWDGLWADNQESMLRFIEFGLAGARGRVTDGRDGAPLHATVRVLGVDAAGWAPAFTDPDLGDYHRPLLPGTYELEATAPGYASATATVTVPAGGAAVTADFTLAPSAEPDPADPCLSERALPDAPYVLKAMRAFRDRALMPSTAGRAAVRGYYGLSASVNRRFPPAER